MLPHLDIFGFELPTYGMMAVIASIVGCFFIYARFRKFGFGKDEWASVVTYILIGVLVGSKLLYLITVWPDFIGDIGKLPFGEFAGRYITGGLVFYGGIIGAIVCVFLYAKAHRQPLSKLTVALVPSIPLIHGIARIGCFLAGCCGGSVCGLPIQLVESGLLFVMFGVLYAVCRVELRRPIALGLYLCIYSVMRFVLEFFRTDELRGFIGSLSTSQFISCFLLPLGLLLIIFANPIFAFCDRFTTSAKPDAPKAE